MIKIRNILKIIFLALLVFSCRERSGSTTIIHIVGKINDGERIVINGVGPDNVFFSEPYEGGNSQYAIELPHGNWFFYAIHLDSSGLIKCGLTTDNYNGVLRNPTESVEISFTTSNCKNTIFNSDKYKSSSDHIRQLSFFSCHELPTDSKMSCDSGLGGSVQVSLSRVILSPIDNPDYSISDNVKLECIQFDDNALAELEIELPVDSQWKYPFHYDLKVYSDNNCTELLETFNFSSINTFYSKDKISILPTENSELSSVFILNPKKLNNDECKSSNECKSSFCNNLDFCEDPTCTDGEKNDIETDIDCGGNECNSCSLNLQCTENSDCDSGFCLENICTISTCDDDYKNGSETDVNCGGESCSSCNLTFQCLTSTDCNSESCVNNICTTPNCSDGVKNGDEVDIDCGGTQCISTPCSGGSSCIYGSDCESGICQDESCVQGCNLITNNFDMFDDINNWTEDANPEANGDWPLTFMIPTCGFTSDDIAGPYYDTIDDNFVDRPGTTIQLSIASQWCILSKTVSLSADFGYSSSQLSDIDVYTSFYYLAGTLNGEDSYSSSTKIYSIDDQNTPIAESVLGSTSISNDTWQLFEQNTTYSGLEIPDEIYFTWSGLDDGDWAGYYGPQFVSPRISILGHPCPSCNDDVQNQNETGVDCGGVCDACER